MAVEMAIWRMTDNGPHPLVSSPLDSEQRLEDMLAEDPSMSGTNLRGCICVGCVCWRCRWTRRRAWSGGGARHALRCRS